MSLHMYVYKVHVEYLYAERCRYKGGIAFLVLGSGSFAIDVLGSES